MLDRTATPTTGTYDGPSKADHAEAACDHGLPEPPRPARLVGRECAPTPERDGAGVGAAADAGPADEHKDHMHAGEDITHVVLDKLLGMSVGTFSSSETVEQRRGRCRSKTTGHQRHLLR